MSVQIRRQGPSPSLALCWPAPMLGLHCRRCSCRRWRQHLLRCRHQHWQTQMPLPHPPGPLSDSLNQISMDQAPRRGPSSSPRRITFWQTSFFFKSLGNAQLNGLPQVLKVRFHFLDHTILGQLREIEPSISTWVVSDIACQDNLRIGYKILRIAWTASSNILSTGNSAKFSWAASPQAPPSSPLPPPPPPADCPPSQPPQPPPAAAVNSSVHRLPTARRRSHRRCRRLQQ
jgi:hypothetical protein